MRIKQIKMLLKREQWQEVIISEETGYDMPETATDLVEMCEDLKIDPASFSESSVWADADITLEKFTIEEEE